MIIDGQGLVTIDGLESSKFFINVTAGYTLTLQNVSITNYYTGTTNTGLITNYGTLNIVNCNIYENYVEEFAMINNHGKLKVDSSTFFENRAYDGGAIYTSSSEDVYIIDSIFAFNTAEGYGGAIEHVGTGKLYIENSIFTENQNVGIGSISSAPARGGVIYSRNAGNIIIQDSTFNLNTATVEDNYGYGGVICLRDTVHAYIINSKFIENTVTTNNNNALGGVIYSSGSSCTIINSEFIDNKALQGGVIYSTGNLEIYSSKFSENSADYGGVIYNAGDNLEISSSEFTENSAEEGGVIYNACDNLEISYSNFTENTASIGGVIYTYGDNVKISSSEFSENSADYGGAIVNFVDLTIEESTFKNNNAQFGGAIYSEPGPSPSTLKISNTNFTENSADYGGAVINLGYAEYYTGTLTIEGSRFYTNTATEYGGAIYNDEYGDLTLTGNYFEGNEGQYKDTIFTVVEINEMTGNTIVMSNYDVNTFDNVKIYSPIIDTTVETDSNAEPTETIIYEITHPSEKKTSEVITYKDGYDTHHDYQVNDGGIYTINIVYRNSENTISYKVYSHDVTHIVLDSNIVATPGETITINGYLYSTNKDQKYDDYSNKKVTVYINGEQLKDVNDNPTQLTVDENGHFEFEITPVEGYNSIYVVYDGYIINRTTYIAGSSNITGFTTNDHNAIITATADPDKFNVTQSTNINGIITDLEGIPLEGTTIDVTVQISDGTTTTVTATNGEFVYEFDATSEGTYTFIFSCDGDYTAVSDPVYVTVVKTNTNIKIDTSNVKIGENRNITLTLQSDFGYNIAGAKLVVSVNGVNKQVTNVGNGIYTIKTGELTAGTYTIIASFEGDNTFYGTEKITTFKVSKLETKVSIDHLDNIVPGEEVTITGSLTLSDGTTPIPYTSLVVIINGEEYPEDVVTDESGHFSIPYTVPSNGQLDIVVLYRGSDIYENSYDEDVDTSDLPPSNRTNIPTTTTVGGIIGEFGETVNLTAIVLDEDGYLVPEGQVLFKINDVTVKDENGNILYADVVNGIARLPYTITNSPKNYTIMAVYQGTDTYLPSSSNYALLIVEASEKIPTTTIVDSITGQYGETVNLTATVYDEDGNLVDEGKVIFKINDVTLKDEDGNVIYVDVENGVAKLPYTITNNPKNYTIMAVYQGTDKYMESRSDYATLTVEGEVKNKIHTTTIVEGITGQKGETVNLTATVYDEYGNLVPEGQVLFKLNDVTIKDENGNIRYADVVNGVARLPYTITNSPKNYTLLAIYQGTDNYYSSKSDYSTLYVVAEDTKIPTVTYVDSITAREGETVNLTATVYDKNQNKVTEGQVYFEIDNQIVTDANGNILYATVVDGVAKLPYTVTQDIGNYTLKAVYTENNKYYGSESDTNGSVTGGGEGVPTLTVVGENYMIPTSTTVNGVTAKQGDIINLTANVVDEYGNPVSEGQLSFKIDGVSITDTDGNIIYVDVTDGVAKLPYTVTQDLGNYTITAEYYGTDKYLPSQADDTVVPGSAGKLVVVDKDANITTNIVVDDAIQQWGDVVKFTATITDEYGNPVTGGKVAFKLNGVTIKDGNGDVRYVQVVDGKVELYYTVTNNVKDYTITAVYSGYDIFESSRSNEATFTVTPRSVNMTTDKLDDNIKSGDTVTFKATISEYDRTYTDNGVVVFKLNGKTIRDEEGNPIVVDVNNGVATLDYQIPVDFAGKDYNITAVYTNNNYLRAEANNTLTTVRSNIQTVLNPITVSHGQDANIYMVLYDENGNQLERETKVAIKINGHTIIHMNTTAGVLNATIPASEITQTTNRIDVVLGENQGYYELRLNTTLRVES